MGEYLVGIYKEIDKKPDVIKIKNQKIVLEFFFWRGEIIWAVELFIQEKKENNIK